MKASITVSKILVNGSFIHPREERELIVSQHSDPNKVFVRLGDSDIYEAEIAEVKRLFEAIPAFGVK